MNNKKLANLQRHWKIFTMYLPIIGQVSQPTNLVHLTADLLSIDFVEYFMTNATLPHPPVSQ